MIIFYRGKKVSNYTIPMSQGMSIKATQSSKRAILKF